MNEPFHELDLTISDGAREWQQRARTFAQEYMAPVGRQLDLMSPEDAVASESPYFEFLSKARNEGFLHLTAPPALGGRGLSRLEEYLVLEELATGDAGLATALFIAPLVYQFVYDFGSLRLVDEIAKPYFEGRHPEWSSCFAITDSRHGSDMMAAHTPSLVVSGGDLTAREDGESWVLDGQKAPWASCAATATHALVCCTIDSANLAHGGIAVVPLDTDGVVKGAPLDKLGLRPLNQASLAFTDVRIPKDHMIIGQDAYGMAMHATHTVASVSMALLAFGTGRAAYEGAVRYTRERVQGGKVLREHQATQLRLFSMFTKLEAARALTRATYTHNYDLAAQGKAGSLAHSCAAKVFTTEAAFEVCDAASQLCGARSTDRQGIRFDDGSIFSPEKLLRDAKSFKIADGENTLLALIGAAQLG
ncbi:acyl-CoA dehydrogenase family protein [Amycolatopsis thailandensis]|uniref:acyl-CoA dehydrogenase family protein n=1 Tax=Amycolatopsis thailandensis TaxID=589330 RepID=UPI00362B94C7